MLKHIGGLMREGKCSVKVLKTKEIVVQSFKKLISDAVYREKLYSNLG